MDLERYLSASLSLLRKEAPKGWKAVLSIVWTLLGSSRSLLEYLEGLRWPPLE